MRAKRNNVCQECRLRKLGCDGKLPACSQCTIRRLPCSGYQQACIFMPQPSNSAQNAVDVENSNKPKPSHQKKVLSLDKKCQHIQAVSCNELANLNKWSRLQESQHYSLEQDIRFIVEQYAPINSSTPAVSNPWHNQICGAWVDALPLLFSKGQIEQFLSAAIAAFAAALRHYCLGSETFQPKTLEAYCKSLKLVGSALDKVHGNLGVGHATAIMCLAVTELILPTSETSWMKHATAVENFMEHLGPKPFADGVLHKLLVGFRPLLLISAITNRKKTFLARDEWTVRPQEQPISLMQSLLNEAAQLPALLERYADSEDLAETSRFTTLQHLYRDFDLLLRSLEDWEAAAARQSSSPLYWRICDSADWLAPGTFSLWFPDIMTANSLTYCWAFQIVVLTHLELICRAMKPTRGCGHQTCEQHLSEPSTQRINIKLADMICNSMPYLMQPKMKLWGPASAYFTFTTAIRVFQENKKHCTFQLSHCQRLVDWLAEMQIHFPGIKGLIS